MSEPGMARWLWLGLLAALAGCERDPSFFGVWDVVRAERGGATQTDVGVLEILDNGSVAMLLRYTWSGGGFAPDPRPSVVFGDTSETGTDDIADDYRSKGETYTLWIEPFGQQPFDVAEYTVSRARLESASAAWPGRPEDLAPMSLVLVR